MVLYQENVILAAEREVGRISSDALILLGFEDLV